MRVSATVLTAAIVAAALGGAAAQTLPPRGCATALAIQHRLPPGSASGKSARVLAIPLQGRTYLTAHFAIHYTLGDNTQHPKWTPADAFLHAKRDSLMASLASIGNITRRDSALDAKLDSLGAPHPFYVQRAGAFFEKAYAYYNDSLGMLMPTAIQSDVFAEASPTGHYTVNIADLGVAKGYPGYYAVTEPPPVGASSTITIENDFVYGGTLQANGDVTGSHMTVDLADTTRDYTINWEMGLKVTAVHEFYHAVQFTYTPSPDAFHAWYELSAVGMEERLAPEVDDYFQYLPYLLQVASPVSLLTPPSTENYANGLFHQYLTRLLGRAFDVTMWNRFKAMQSLPYEQRLPDALQNLVGSTARLDSIYTSYAAALATAGRAGSAATCTDTTAQIFTRDLRCWPLPTFATVTAGSTQLALPPGSFRFVRAPGAGDTLSADLPGASGAWRIDRAGSTYTPVFLPGTHLSLAGTADSSVFALSLANSSLTDPRTFRVYKTSPVFSAFPNPVSRTQAVSFVLPHGASSSSPLTVLSESGRAVASLAPDSNGTSWSWNLKDGLNRAVPPGVYFFKTPGQLSKTLLVLP